MVGVEIRDTLTLNRSARCALFTSFALLLVNFIGYRALPDSWKGLVSLLIIPAYCCGLAAFVRFVYSEKAHAGSPEQQRAHFAASSC